MLSLMDGMLLTRVTCKVTAEGCAMHESECVMGDGPGQGKINPSFSG